jgi:hypothetical protein
MRLPGASAVTAKPRRTNGQKITKRYACAPYPVFKQALKDRTLVAVGFIFRAKPARTPSDMQHISADTPIRYIGV